MSLQALVLGIVQGVTEFLPVSSTAHLIIVPYLFDWKGTVNTFSFNIALHGGTLMALLVFFRTEILSILRGNWRLLGLLAAGTVPIGISGLLLKEFVENSLRTPTVVASTLVIFGVYMLLAERISTRRGFNEITFLDAIAVGMSQALAIVPGVSRSGVTISTAMFCRLQRTAAARFSFLLSLPAIAGAVLVESIEMLKEPDELDFAVIMTGFVVSFITGLLCLKFLLWFFRGFSMKGFVYYRFVLAGIILLVLWTQG